MLFSFRGITAFSCQISPENGLSTPFTILTSCSSPRKKKKGKANLSDGNLIWPMVTWSVRIYQLAGPAIPLVQEHSSTLPLLWSASWIGYGDWPIFTSASSPHDVNPANRAFPLSFPLTLWYLAAWEPLALAHPVTLCLCAEETPSKVSPRWDTCIVYYSV